MYIRAFVPHVPDAEDIMQETALVMWCRFDQFKEDGDFAAWGIGIARHFVLKLEHKRFNKRIKFSSEIVALLEKSMATHARYNDARVAAVQRCRGKLPAQDAELVRLKYDEGYSTVKIARITGRPLQGLYKVMARIHRDLLYCVERTLRTMNHET
jgi:RNA polymerase sigma-70 factor (ECF subfamily)